MMYWGTASISMSTLRSAILNLRTHHPPVIARHKMTGIYHASILLRPQQDFSSLSIPVLASVFGHFQASTSEDKLAAFLTTANVVGRLSSYDTSELNPIRFFGLPSLVSLFSFAGADLSSWSSVFSLQPLTVSPIPFDVKSQTTKSNVSIQTELILVSTTANLQPLGVVLDQSDISPDIDPFSTTMEQAGSALGDQNIPSNTWPYLPGRSLFTVQLFNGHVGMAHHTLTVLAKTASPGDYLAIIIQEKQGVLVVLRDASEVQTQEYTLVGLAILLDSVGNIDHSGIISLAQSITHSPTQITIR
jgi:hypothetical protein